MADRCEEARARGVLKCGRPFCRECYGPLPSGFDRRPPPSKRYLGDAVYVDAIGSMLVITTEDGVSQTNVVMLEPEVWAALVQYVEQLKESRRG